jgi:hypothetical protein
MIQAIRAVASDIPVIVSMSRLITAPLLSYKRMQDMGHFWMFMALTSGLYRSNRGIIYPAERWSSRAALPN